ncbi:MAG TPA: (d)CMP kinase [Pseudomonadales bacterium]|jgi:cytidylate kinase|nr:(d)CMP kinase [Pseudomonadales bacterium]
MITEEDIPVIAVDGPSGSGKGTVCRLLARELGWNLLDSGAMYRLVGLAARNHGVRLDNHAALDVLAGHLDVQFRPGEDTAEARVILEGEDVSQLLRTEEVGALASEVAAVPAVRASLLRRQRAFKIRPGLVADGRDMGTVVFPEAQFKVFLTASADERARRRYKQLKDKGEAVSLPRLVADIEARDRRDTERSVAPLRAAPDAVTVDTTGMGIQEVFDLLMAEVKERGML